MLLTRQYVKIGYGIDTLITATSSRPTDHDHHYDHCRQYTKAMEDATKAVLYRHTFPGSWWKLKRWLGIGEEKKLKNAMNLVYQLVDKCLVFKLDEKQGRKTSISSAEDEEDELDDGCDDLLTAQRKVWHTTNFSDKVNMVNYFFAGKEVISACLTWFLWLLLKNPSEIDKIRDEITTMFPNIIDGNRWKRISFLNPAEATKLIYLSAALSDALRLCPPVAIQHKAPTQDGILPSGSHSR